MSNPLFVDREGALARLQGWLEAVQNGQGYIGFVAGEAGAGKTTLIQEFARQAQEQHPTLIVATGSCDAYTGAGDAYLPFRELLELLTGDIDAKLAAGTVTTVNAQRLRRIVARSTEILLNVGFEVIKTFVPMGNLIAAAGESASKVAGLDKKLEQLAKSSSASGAGAPSVTSEQIFEQYLTFLRQLAAQQPLLILLDDLHWADASSLGLLFHIARRIKSTPILIVGSYRPIEVDLGRGGERHPFEKVLAEIRRYEGDVVLDLDQMASDEARAFVDAFLDSEMNSLGYDFRQALAEHTGGNPLFVVELLRVMQERGDITSEGDGEWKSAPGLAWNDLPVRVEGVIEERIGRLSADLRETLTVASVEGEQFTAEIVARLRKVEERDLIRKLGSELARRHHLVAAVGSERTGASRLSTYRFSSRPIQAYLHRSLDQAERAYLHEDVARLLEEFYAGQLDEIALQLARHYAEAGLDAQAAHYLRRAAGQAAARFAHFEAAGLLDRALALTPRGDTAAQFDTLLALETAHQWQGKRQQQAEDLVALSALAEKMGDPRKISEVHLRRAEHARAIGNYPVALEGVEKAIEAAGRAAATDLEGRAYGLWGRILAQQDDYREAEEWLRLAVELTGDSGPADVAARAIYDLGNTAFLTNRFREAQSQFEKAAGMYRELGDRRGMVSSLYMTGATAGKLGDYVRGTAVLEEALAACRAIGWRQGETYMLGALGDTHVELGRYEAAAKWLEEALAVCREVEDLEGEALSLDSLGLVRHRQGALPAAIDLFKAALQIDEKIAYRRGSGYAFTHLGHALLDAGELTKARAAFDQALTIRTELDPASGVLADTLAGLAVATLAQGDPAAAALHARAALARLDAAGNESAEYAAQVYWLCHQVLKAASSTDPGAAREAEQVLARGRSWVADQADRIQAPALRDSFLRNVPFNRSLAALTETRGRAG